MSLSQSQLQLIKTSIREKALAHGFQDLRVSDTTTGEYFTRFKSWVDRGLHGDMSFLERNQSLRESPEALHPNTVRVLSLRYDYLPPEANFSSSLKDKNSAYVSRYALGRDYHKLIRKKLNALVTDLTESVNLNTEIDYRVLVDSAPVLETAFAEKSGLGWKGKHTLVINENAGSWFFLGEIFINLPLPTDPPVKDQCGSCSACINLCPTDAILDNGEVDARRCISYLTIENKNEIPVELRPLLGNRIYGCDDCQLACPWNRQANITHEKDFLPRNQLDNSSLLSLWSLSEKEFLERFSGSPIRRIGFQSWLRNLAVAIGNSQNQELISHLENKKEEANEMVLEHIEWAIEQLQRPANEIVMSGEKKTQKLIRTIEAMLPRDA